MKNNRFTAARKTTSIWLSLVLLLVGSLPSYANSFTIELDKMFAGTAAPQLSAPWLTATFESYDADTVKLTLRAVHLYSDAGNPSLDEYVSIWDFNFNPAKNVADLDFVFDVSLGASNPTSAIETGGSYTAGDTAVESGPFDFKMTFKTASVSDRFSQGHSSAWYINYSGGELSPEDFFYYTEGGNTDQLLTAALINNTGPDHNGYAWVTPDASSTLSLLGFALLGLGGIRKRKLSA